MSKRFTCTDKWKKKWIRKLSPKHKLFWVFLLDTCDHAGILDYDLDLFSFMLGVDFDMSDIKKDFGDKLVFFNNDDKVFIPKFIEFQYGELNEANKVHKSVINLLKKQGLYKPLTSPLQRAKDKDKDKVKSKDKVKEDFDTFWNLYAKKQDRQDVFKKWSKLSEKEHQDIIAFVPAYVKSTPDIQYRRMPTTFLNKRTWENDIMQKSQDPKSPLYLKLKYLRFSESEIPKAIEIVNALYSDINIDKLDTYGGLIRSEMNKENK